MDSAGKIFTIIFGLGFILTVIQVLISPLAGNFYVILFFIVIPAIIVVWATAKNRNKAKRGVQRGG